MVRPLAVKWALLLVSILSIMTSTVVTPALPYIEQAFSYHPDAAMYSRLVLTLPPLFIVICAPIAGAISDRYGRKTMLLSSLVLYGISGVSAFFTESITLILAGRALMGVAMAMCMTTTSALIADYFEGAERASLLGLQMAVTTVGAVLCLTIGGYVVDIDWQRPFLGYSFALLLFPVAALFLYEPERHQHAPKTEGHISGLSLLALILLITFCGSMVIYSIAVQVPFYLKSRFGIGGLGIGLVISSGTLCATFLSLYYGRLRSRLSYPAILVISYLMMGGGFAIVGLAPTVWVLVGGLCFAGGCSGILMPSLNNWLTDVFASASRGKVLGSLNTAIFLGQFMSPIVLTPLLNKVSYTGFFIIIGAAMAFTGGLIWFVRGYLQTASDVLKAQIESKMT